MISSDNGGVARLPDNHREAREKAICGLIKFEPKIDIARIIPLSIALEGLME